MPEDTTRASFGRFRPLISRLISLRDTSQRARTWFLAASAAVFLIVSILSFRSLAGRVEMHWSFLPVLVVVTSPLTLAANAAEFRAMGRINGHRIAWLDSARLTVVATVANLLPIPGGIVIRAQALRQRGSTYRHAFAANAVAGLIWIGCAAIAIAGLSLGAAENRAGAWTLAALSLVAVACLVAAGYILRQTRQQTTRRIYLSLVVIEAGTVLISSARIYLAFRLIGLSASASQSVALTAAQIVAAAVGIFPAGLGLREALAGVIGALVQVGAGPAVAASAADRVTGQVSLAIVGALLLVMRVARPAPSMPAASELDGLPQLHDTP